MHDLPFRMATKTTLRKPGDTSPCLFYLNPLFDLSLAGYTSEKLDYSAAEMGFLFIPLATAHDKIILSVKAKDDYWQYLFTHGITCPEPFKPDIRSCNSLLKGIPWGWNKQALLVLKDAGAYCDHPPLTVVKRVNSRRFSFTFNQTSKTGVPFTEFCESMSQLFYRLQHWSQFPLVIKPEFGNAGYGFVIKHNTKILPQEYQKYKAFFSNGKGVILEAWLPRIMDISSCCYIYPQGTISTIRHHRTLSTRTGTFFADFLHFKDEKILAWKELLDEAVLACAIEIGKTGYYGPVGFDSFLWRDNTGKENIARIIEINCRHAMSSIAYALYDKLTPRGVSLFRFISKKRHKLPRSYHALKQVLGKHAYDPNTQKGVILLTPLRVRHSNGDWVQPRRSAFFIAAETTQALFTLDDTLRKIILGK